MIVKDISQEIKGTASIKAGLQICEILLFAEETAQFNLISKFVAEHTNASALSAYQKSILYFRQYQLSGEKELFTQCLIVCPNEMIRKVLNTLASRVKEGKL